jgi:hypothetical protein
MGRKRSKARNKKDQLALVTFGARRRKALLTAVEIVLVSMKKSLFEMGETCITA